MSRVNSPTNNSGSSSETSEVQSFEDKKTFAESPVSKNFISQNRTSRGPKSIKEFGSYQSGDKEGETKRPPWRAVSVSTLPKPDKNAILKAKLLDASRHPSSLSVEETPSTIVERVALISNLHMPKRNVNSEISMDIFERGISSASLIPPVNVKNASSSSTI